MTVTVVQAAEYVGADSEIEPALTVLPVLLTTATDLIGRHMRRSKRKTPDSILDYATLQLVSELWTRRNAPGGVAAFADGVPVRMARDAMVSVLPLLNPDKGIGAVG